MGPNGSADARKRQRRHEGDTPGTKAGAAAAAGWRVKISGIRHEVDAQLREALSGTLLLLGEEGQVGR